LRGVKIGTGEKSVRDQLDAEPSSKIKVTSDFALNQLEKWVNYLDVIRFWFTRSGRIGLLMAKGGYLLSERKKLFKRLGEETYYRIQKGDLSLSELIPLTEEIKDLTQKIEIEELLIRRLRFGTSYKRKKGSPSETPDSQEPTLMT
jgi:hypothetical protein